MNLKFVLFDWNGTVLNDIPTWHKSVKEIFRIFEKNPPTIEEYFRELEGDYIEIYRSRGINASRDELNAIYEPFYEAHVTEAALFPGVVKTLNILAERGITMGLVTAQKDFLVSPLLTKFGINDFFRYREFHALDKKTVIQRILTDGTLDPKECCFIGDAPSDIRHGKKAGVTTIAFLSGHIPEALILKAEPELTIHSFEDIVQAIGGGAANG